jgi:DNA-binding transcriptional regulator YiaG
MADMLGIHVATYQNWEKEPEKISVSMADKIVSILGIEPNEIIFKSDPAEAEVTA